MVNLNHLYDIILLGASSENIKLAKKLTALNKDYAIISRSAKSNEFDSLNSAVADIKFIEYEKGIFRLSSSNNRIICGQKLVLSTGTIPKRLNSKIKNVFYRIGDVVVNNSATPGIIIGNGDIAAKNALELAKKSSYIYICCADSFNCSEKLFEKLKKNEKIIVLNNTSAINSKLVKQNNNISNFQLETTTYDTINYDYILALTDRVIDLPVMVHGLVELDGNNKIITNTYGMTTKFKTVFAVGDCANSFDTKNLSVIAKNI